MALVMFIFQLFLLSSLRCRFSLPFLCWKVSPTQFCHGLPGSQRFARLFDAAQQGAHAPPVDLRFISKPYAHCNRLESDSVRADCISYLNTLYQSVAEVIPDVKDDTFDDIDPNSLPSSGVQVELDSYEIELKKCPEEQDQEKSALAERMACKPAKTKKVRTVRRGVKMNPDRMSTVDTCETHEAGSFKTTTCVVHNSIDIRMDLKLNEFTVMYGGPVRKVIAKIL